MSKPNPSITISGNLAAACDRAARQAQKQMRQNREQATQAALERIDAELAGLADLGYVDEAWAIRRAIDSQFDS